MIVLIIIVSCIVLNTKRVTTTPVPAQQVEQEDCDAEDRAKKQWWECGPGVLDPKKSPKPAVANTPKSKVTKR